MQSHNVGATATLAPRDLTELFDLETGAGSTWWKFPGCGASIACDSQAGRRRSICGWFAGLPASNEERVGPREHRRAPRRCWSRQTDPNEGGGSRGAPSGEPRACDRSSSPASPNDRSASAGDLPAPAMQTAEPPARWLAPRSIVCRLEPDPEGYKGADGRSATLHLSRRSSRHGSATHNFSQTGSHRSRR